MTALLAVPVASILLYSTASFIPFVLPTVIIVVLGNCPEFLAVQFKTVTQTRQGDKISRHLIHRIFFPRRVHLDRSVPCNQWQTTRSPQSVSWGRMSVVTTTSRLLSRYVYHLIACDNCHLIFCFSLFRLLCFFNSHQVTSCLSSLSQQLFFKQNFQEPNKHSLYYKTSKEKSLTS